MNFVQIAPDIRTNQKNERINKRMNIEDETNEASTNHIGCALDFKTHDRFKRQHQCCNLNGLAQDAASNLTQDLRKKLTVIKLSIISVQFIKSWQIDVCNRQRNLLMLLPDVRFRNCLAILLGSDRTLDTILTVVAVLPIQSRSFLNSRTKQN